MRVKILFPRLLPLLLESPGYSNIVRNYLQLYITSFNEYFFCFYASIKQKRVILNLCFIENLSLNWSKNPSQVIDMRVLPLPDVFQTEMGQTERSQRVLDHKIVRNQLTLARRIYFNAVARRCSIIGAIATQSINIFLFILKRLSKFKPKQPTEPI